MRLRPSVVAWLHRLLQRRVAQRRPPDFIIGGEADPYLRRWWVIPRNPVFNVYLHHFCRSDDDRALHDHPWVNVSILLTGEYLEHAEVRRRSWFTGRALVRWSAWRRAGDIVARRPTAAHRIEVDEPVWTLFVTGPRVREWGFHCPQGWKHWQDFTAFRTQGDSGRVGPGCDG